MADGRGQSGCSSENFNAKEAVGLNALALVLYTLMENWCQGFRCRLSRMLLKPMRLLASRFGTNVKAAAAFSPWGCIFATCAHVVWPADTLAAGSFKGFADELFGTFGPRPLFFPLFFPFPFPFLGAGRPGSSGLSSALRLVGAPFGCGVGLACVDAVASGSK